jgi:uncharacterized iron-regulated protein
VSAAFLIGALLLAVGQGGVPATVPAPTPAPAPAKSSDPPLAARLLDAASGAEVDVAAIADVLARRDVVFFGEQHDSADAHARELELAEELFARRPDLVLSFEMFERDRQGVLDDYLAGRLDEAQLLAQARPWPNYADAYKPLIEFAKDHHLPVVAACIPWSTAVAFGKSQGEPPRSPFVARDWSAPADAYRARFVEVVKDHVKPDDASGPNGAPKPATKFDPLERMYRSQCLRDDTMAESIADALTRWKHRRVLVLHFCGAFHSDFGQGTVARVLTRVPSASIGIVTTIEADVPAQSDAKPESARANYVLFVPKPPPKSEAPETKEPAAPKAAVTSEPTKPASN